MDVKIDLYKMGIKECEIELFIFPSSLFLSMSHVYISLREEILCSTHYPYSLFYYSCSDLFSFKEDNFLSYDNLTQFKNARPLSIYKRRKKVSYFL